MYFKHKKFPLILSDAKVRYYDSEHILLLFTKCRLGLFHIHSHEINLIQIMGASKNVNGMDISRTYDN